MLNFDHRFSLVTALACPVLNGFCILGTVKSGYLFSSSVHAGGMDVLSSTAAGEQLEWILVLSWFYSVTIRGLIVVCRPTCKPSILAQAGRTSGKMVDSECSLYRLSCHRQQKCLDKTGHQVA